MKKLLLLIACLLLSLCVTNLNAANKVIVNGNLNKYIYAYVMPTSGVTSNSGGSGFVVGDKYGVYGSVSKGPTSTVNPAEKISGCLMKLGFTVVPNVSPDFVESTMIVSYGFWEGEAADLFSSSHATILIQFRDGKTQELVASYETTGYGSNEAESISNAISETMELFQNTLDPKIAVKFGDVFKNHFYVYLTNRTLEKVNHIDLRVIYYINGEEVHSQDVSANSELRPNEQFKLKIKRDKPAQSNKMQIRVKVQSYK